MAATAPTTTAAPTRSPKQAAADYAALNRAEEGQSLMNYGLIFAGMMEKGISEAEIRPRENVFTFRAWRAKSRLVNPGEKGVSVITFRRDKEGNSFPWFGTVFHESQTRCDTDPKPPKLEPTPEADAHHQAQRDRAGEAKAEALKVAPVEPIAVEEAPTPEPEPEAVPVIDAGPQLSDSERPDPLTLRLRMAGAKAQRGPSAIFEPADLAPDGTGAEPEPVNDGFEWRVDPKDCPHTQRLIRPGMPCVACGDTCDKGGE
jgi:hypothetical protein